MCVAAQYRVMVDCPKVFGRREQRDTSHKNFKFDLFVFGTVCIVP